MTNRNQRPRKRFDLVRRKFDGKIIKWEQKRLSELGILPEPADYGMKQQGVPVLSPSFDHEVWVVTGVFNHRHEAFK